MRRTGIKSNEVRTMLDRGVRDLQTLSGYSGLTLEYCRTIKIEWARANGIKLPPDKPVKRVSKKCEKCVYWKPLSRGNPNSDYFCDYIGIHYRKRGCEGGDNCTQFMQRSKNGTIKTDL